MMNSILHLRYAVEVEKTGSLSKAAQNLYVGQPQISKALKELEGFLGITIFNRTSKGATPTKKGLEFLTYAKNILKQVDDMEALYKQDTVARRDFNISAPRASYISYAFAEFIKPLINKDLNFSYRENNALTAIKNVSDNAVNLAIIRYPVAYAKYFLNAVAEKDLDYKIILDFQFSAVMSVEHPLAQKKTISFQDLSKYTEIVHGDRIVPALPIAEVKEIAQINGRKKKISVYERGSQFELLHRIKTTFMWVSPLPQDVLDSFGLVQRKCERAKNAYNDTLIFRKNYQFSKEDRLFLEKIEQAIKVVVLPT